MKRFFTIILCAVLLCGCTPAAAPETEPAEVTTPQQLETAPAMTQPTETIPAETLPPETAPAETVYADPIPYTLALHAAVPIYGGPSYDEFCVRIVGEDGVYTIVEETEDAEGNCWGRLKSGAGWVDLTALDMSVPITAAFADDALLQGGNYHAFTAEESEYLTLIAFRAREPVADVTLSLLEPDWDSAAGYVESRSLYTLPALTPDSPLVAGVVFYGDLTAYGLSFTDAEGVSHHYAVTISGRNGALVTEEYEP